MDEEPFNLIVTQQVEVDRRLRWSRRTSRRAPGKDVGQQRPHRGRAAPADGQSRAVAGEPQHRRVAVRAVRAERSAWEQCCPRYQRSREHGGCGRRRRRRRADAGRGGRRRAWIDACADAKRGAGGCAGRSCEQCGGGGALRRAAAESARSRRGAAAQTLRPADRHLQADKPSLLREAKEKTGGEGCVLGDSGGPVEEGAEGVLQQRLG
mmetsp:Transcript_1824/g.6570  ORF Transcript_1824/g.6570 Transcript_1824/m.6570 type:complete len:209 (+) Transcript_1824:3-629(+)